MRDRIPPHTFVSLMVSAGLTKGPREALNHLAVVQRKWIYLSFTWVCLSISETA